MLSRPSVALGRHGAGLRHWISKSVGIRQTSQHARDCSGWLPKYPGGLASPQSAET